MRSSRRPKENFMIKVRNLGLLLALSSVAALPACSMFGGGSSRSQSSSAGYPSQSYASAQQPNYSSTPPMQQSTEQQPLTSDTIRGVQQTLQQDGLYHSRVDGVWGPSSQSALRQYQQQHNMNPTGQLDQQTLAALNQGSDNGQNYGG
jgi:peptidoglycan hydrolase-like protein with peptidoglycan-binding domain